jgi:hypothetical protein
VSFVNNIPYSPTMPKDKMPKVRDYGYFLLHLEEKKKTGEYMAAEEAVLEQLKTGAVDWLPDERCLQLTIEASESTRVDQVRCRRAPTHPASIRLTSAACAYPRSLKADLENWRARSVACRIRRSRLWSFSKPCWLRKRELLFKKNS